METIKDVTQLFVAIDTTNTAGVEADVISSYSDLTDGEVVVCDHKNVVLTSSDNLVAADFPTQRFKLIARSGTTLIQSPLIGQGEVTGYAVGTQVAEAQQLDYVGSNGTTGALDVITDNLYTIRLYIQESTIQGFMQQKIKEGFYKSASSTTQYAVALGLQNSLVKNYSREPEQDMVFQRVNSGARTAVPTGTVTFAFSKGSKVWTCTDIDDATATAALVVGDLLVIGTGTTDAVYRIETMNTTTNTGTFDMEYQGASGSILDTALTVIVIAAISDYGIKIQGVDRGFQPGYRTAAPITWSTSIDFGDGATATVNKTTAANIGVGTAQQLANLEKELQADENVYRSFVEGGVVDRAQITPAALAAGTLYDVVIIDYFESNDSGPGVAIKSPKQIIIASSGGGPNSVLEDADSGVIVALDKIIVTNWATPGLVVLQALLT